MKTERIYLTGFMTCGKSTIGPILANVLGWNFFDLDKEIEKSIGLDIVSIFEQFGEDYFRTIERETLKKVSQEKNIIISLGGGTFCNEENFNIIKELGKTIYIKVSVENLYKRLRNKLNRPLFRDLVEKKSSPEKFYDRIRFLLNTREKFYNRADIIFEAENSKIGITVDKLARIIEREL